MIGKLLATGIPRDSLAIATKAGFIIRNGRRIIDTSRAALLNDLEGSLRRLRTDHVDLWQVHAWGQAPIEETLSALDSAVSRGLARYAGVSNFVGWQTATAATWQEAMAGRTKLASVQVEYSLLARRAEVEVIGAAQYHSMGLLAWSAMGRGALTGRYRRGVPKDSRAASEHFGWFLEPYLQPRSRAVIDAVATPAVAVAKPIASAQDEAMAADLLTFRIGMGVVAAVLLVMTIVGAVVASAPLLIGSGIFTVVLAGVNAGTDVTLVAR